MIGKWLCKMGFHKWETVYEDEIGRVDGQCTRCGKAEHLAYNVVDGGPHWYDGLYWSLQKNEKSS